MSVYVISSSQLGAREEHVANVVKLIDGPHVHHYWDGGQRVGEAAQRFVPGVESPLWDFWMVYRPGVSWSDEAPTPDWWEHQLSALGREFGERRLDAERLVSKALESQPQ